MIAEVRKGFLLIGVAHVLPHSLSLVEQRIMNESPHVVAVELCPFRYAVLTHGPPFVSPSKPKLGEFLLGGLMALVQNRFAHQTGMPAGREMITAIRAASCTGAEIFLIDQDIRTTLHRLSKEMPWREKFMLALQTLFALLPSRKRGALEHLTDEEVVAWLLWEFRKLAPAAYRVLIDERDEYMASRLLPLLTSGKRVICVVGAGHVPGLRRRLEESLREFEAGVWWRESLEFSTGGSDA